MRLSRPRVALRGVLLLFGAGYLFLRAWQLRASTAGDPERVADVRTFVIVQVLVGLVCLATAATAFHALRARTRRHTLRLGDLQPPGAPPAEAPPRSAPPPSV